MVIKKIKKIQKLMAAALVIQIITIFIAVIAFFGKVVWEKFSNNITFVLVSMLLLYMLSAYTYFMWKKLMAK